MLLSSTVELELDVVVDFNSSFCVPCVLLRLFQPPLSRFRQVLEKGLRLEVFFQAIGETPNSLRKAVER